MRFSSSVAALAAVAGVASASKCNSRDTSTKSAGIASASNSTSYNSTSPSSAVSAANNAMTASSSTSTSTASAANSGIHGFNYGAFYLNQAAKVQSDFEYEFNRAKNLPGATGWQSARLYTMIQWGTTNSPIEAIPAAIATKTSLLLGLWVSGGTEALQNELSALEAAISQYGTDFTDLVVGLSVGSEDLYRNANPADNPGVDGTTLIDYINQVRSKISGTSLAGTPIGHVDTYDSFLNSSNTAVIDAVDWLGFDGYPYWESANSNSIGDASDLFFSGLNKTMALAKGKPVYVTETGWPAVGDDYGSAVASKENARIYWQDIACKLISSGVNVWWYILQESQEGQASPDFGLYPAGDLGQVQPYFDFSC